MVEQDLHIRKRLRELLPSLTDEERKQLKANIEADGRVTDPILYWFDGKENVVVDGMHRFDIARRGKIPYHTEPIEIDGGYEEVELWMRARAFGQRNLTPQQNRQLRGEYYNQLKRKDGGHGNQIAEGQIVPPVGNAAQEVAEKAGVSERTVKRDGARVDALGKCSPAVQKGVDAGAFKVSDAEVSTLAKLSKGDQNTVATDLRKGTAKNVNESMKQQGIKAPKTKAKKKPPKKLDRKAYFKQWDQAIGPVVRLVDKIANDVGEKGGASHKVILGQLEACTAEMKDWMGVE